RHGRGRTGEIRPSRPAHGRGRRRDRAVHAVSQVRCRRPRLARPRPLRAVGRSRLDADLRAALSPRLREDDDRGDQALPPVGLDHARPSREFPHAGRGDDDRTARPGTCQRGRHGDRRAAPRRSIRPRARGPSHLRARLRRRSDGGRKPGGDRQLNKLIVLFDDNGISIDGPLSLSDSVDQVKRFEAAGWAATHIDGHDPEAIAKALAKAQTCDRPSLIACRTIIGFGAPSKAGTEKCHGSPPGTAEIQGARDSWGWTEGAFASAAGGRERGRSAAFAGKAAHQAWNDRLKAARAARRTEFERRIRGQLPSDKLAAAVRSVKEKLAATPKEIATRAASETALEALTAAVPEMIGGSADLTGSNNTKPKGMTGLSAADYSGRFIHYGVREHGMASAMNGMALHGGIIPYSGTFLVFSDYCRPAIRLAALTGERVIYVMTHDSIGLGEDGPTHQPVEHLAALRAIPDLYVFRPCDAVETVECWQLALENAQAPSVLALTRQNLPQLRLGYDETNRCAAGAYELVPADGAPEISLFATGSEVSI